MLNENQYIKISVKNTRRPKYFMDVFLYESLSKRFFFVSRPVTLFGGEFSHPELIRSQLFMTRRHGVIESFFI